MTNLCDNPHNQETIEKIGKRICALRKSKGLSREELAFRIGVSHQQIFKYEIGESRITVDRLIAIALALDLKIINFFPANEFGKEISGSSTFQSEKEMKLASQFSKFKKLSPEDLALKLLELFTK